MAGFVCVSHNSISWQPRYTYTCPKTARMRARNHMSVASHNHGRSVLVAPSILSANFAKLGDEVQKVDRQGADWIHVDVMDGHFVPNITFGPSVVKALRPLTRKPIDVHLMIDSPGQFIPQFADAGADIISVHCEHPAGLHLHRTLKLIQEQGCKAGVVLNPNTSVQALENVIDVCDLILVMSVNPGFGGQSFIPIAVRKIREVRDLCRRYNVSPLLEVDGGISAATCGPVIEAGADVLVAGSFVFDSHDYGSAISALRQKSGALQMQ
eukprot:Rmarinus@m.7336